MAQPIREEHQVYHQDNQRFLNEFSNAECMAFVNVYGEIHPNLVREFYSNFRFDGSNISFSMFGTQYAWNLERFAQALRISATGVHSYNMSTNLRDINEVAGPGTVVLVLANKFISLQGRGALKLRIVDLKRSLRSHLEVIRKNILFSDAAGDKVSVAEAVILYCMKLGHTVNAARILAVRMNRVRQSPHQPLIYATLLNRLFYDIGVLNQRMGSYAISTDPIQIPECFDEYEMER